MNTAETDLTTYYAGTDQATIDYVWEKAHRRLVVNPQPEPVAPVNPGSSLVLYNPRDYANTNTASKLAATGDFVVDAEVLGVFGILLSLSALRLYRKKAQALTKLVAL